MAAVTTPRSETREDTELQAYRAIPPAGTQLVYTVNNTGRSAGACWLGVSTGTLGVQRRPRGQAVPSQSRWRQDGGVSPAEADGAPLTAVAGPPSGRDPGARRGRWARLPQTLMMPVALSEIPRHLT